MSNKNKEFLVYENWTADQKAVVHKSSCGHANHDRISEQWLRKNHARNDRWYGYFLTLKDATDFASLLPNRAPLLCQHCLKKENR